MQSLPIVILFDELLMLLVDLGHRTFGVDFSRFSVFMSFRNWRCRMIAGRLMSYHPMLLEYGAYSAEAYCNLDPSDARGRRRCRFSMPAPVPNYSDFPGFDPVPAHTLRENLSRITPDRQTPLSVDVVMLATQS